MSGFLIHIGEKSFRKGLQGAPSGPRPVLNWLCIEVILKRSCLGLNAPRMGLHWASSSRKSSCCSDGIHCRKYLQPHSSSMVKCQNFLYKLQRSIPYSLVATTEKTDNIRQYFMLKCHVICTWHLPLVDWLWEIVACFVNSAIFAAIKLGQTCYMCNSYNCNNKR